jgi:NAD-dependent deacetylase
LQADYDGEVVLITQNVDGLHEAAGAKVIHMHGQLDQALCATCGHRWAAPLEMQAQHPCPACNATTGRPDIVWFGEMPYHMDDIIDHLYDATLFAAIGTSGRVYPAAGFVREAKAAGAWTVELNLDPSDVARDFDDHIVGPASTTVPAWVDSLLV